MNRRVREDDLNELERLAAEVSRLRAAMQATKAAASEALDTREARIAAAEARVAELTEKQYKAAALLIEAQQAAHAAESRVAELERYAEQLKVRVATGNRLRQESDAALDQARGLLERLNTWNETEGSAGDIVLLCMDNAAWLRAHPAPKKADE